MNVLNDEYLHLAHPEDVVILYPAAIRWTSCLAASPDTARKANDPPAACDSASCRSIDGRLVLGRRRSLVVSTVMPSSPASRRRLGVHGSPYEALGR
eukprot:SAG22_NODE_7536_length_730_cov_1.017433_1_plen_97_part_00